MGRKLDLQKMVAPGIEQRVQAALIFIRRRDKDANKEKLRANRIKRAESGVVIYKDENGATRRCLGMDDAFKLFTEEEKILWLARDRATKEDGDAEMDMQ